MDLKSPTAVAVRKQIVQALSEYQMIETGDRILVAVSGGKDSSVLLVLLNEIRKKSKIDFDIQAVILDQKQPGFDGSQFFFWVRNVLGIPLHVLEEDTYSIVTEKVDRAQTYCSLCSRLRRGILYRFAYDNGFSKMALGHHRDDLAETVLLNLFFAGKVASMPPKLLSDDGRNILIRPLVFVAEKQIQELQKQWQFPVIPCQLCGSQDGLQRQQMKKLIADLETQFPHVAQNVLAATKNIRPSQLLDHNLWNFTDFCPPRSQT